MSVYFTEEYPLVRATAGTHVKGKYIAGVPTNMLIDAHWQPLSGKELLNLPELQRRRRSLMIYSEEEIRAIDDIAGIPGDIITIENRGYEVQSVKYYKEAELCAHYEAIAVEINL